LLTGIASACFEDKGNYVYDWVPEVTIAEDFHARDTSILRGQQLTVIPDLKLLLKQDDESFEEAAFRPENYTYRWLAYKRLLSDMTPAVLATTQNLDTNIFLPTSTDNYMIFYSVTEKESGVTRAFHLFNLKVGAGRFTNGWLYLTEEDDGTVDLTVRGTETSSGETVMENGVLGRSGFPYTGGGAKFVYWYSNFSRIIVGTGEATGYLDKVNFEWYDTRLVRYMMGMPLPVNYTFDNVISLGILHWIDSYGNILPMGATVGIIYPPYNILPPSVTGAGYDTIRMAPFVAGTSSSASGQLVYDTKNKKMMAYKGSQASIKTYLDAVTPENQLPNHQIYHMQTYTGNNSSVIAKNLTNGKYYRYVYNYATLQANEEEITNGQLLDQTTYFECDNPNGFFYMAIGNKLYAFRTSGNGTGTLREVTVTNKTNFTFDEVCYMGRYTTIATTQPYIMVATYAGTKGSGKLYYLRANTTEPLEMTIEEEITGLDRVKSISRF
jgi:hypothetical protein